MMKTATCQNCGAVFSDELDHCPYCGTMYRRGAYRQFRQRISGMIDSMLGLRDEAQQSISRMILISFLRSFLILAAVAAAAILASRGARVNYYNDKEMDEKTYQTILWEDDNLEKLDIAYQNDDFETIRRLYRENPQAVSHWGLYPSFSLKEECRNILEAQNFNEYTLQNVLYFLYDPEYYAGYNGMKKVDAGLYGNMRGAVLEMMAGNGYPEEELKDIYEKYSDQYGTISSTDLRAYLEEKDNGEL